MTIYCGVVESLPFTKRRDSLRFEDLIEAKGMIYAQGMGLCLKGVIRSLWIVGGIRKT